MQPRCRHVGVSRLRSSADASVSASPDAESRRTRPPWDVLVGVVTAPFGIRGEMKVRSLITATERFLELEEVALALPGRQAHRFAVEGARFHKGQVLLKLKSMSTMDMAEAWRGAEVWAERDTADSLPAGSFLVTELIGMDVVTTNGRHIGRLDDVEAAPAHDLLCIGKILIPMVASIVKSIDTATRQIVVDPPEGLLNDDAH